MKALFLLPLPQPHSGQYFKNTNLNNVILLLKIFKRLLIALSVPQTLSRIVRSPRGRVKQWAHDGLCLTPAASSHCCLEPLRPAGPSASSLASLSPLQLGHSRQGFLFTGRLPSLIRIQNEHDFLRVGPLFFSLSPPLTGHHCVNYVCRDCLLQFVMNSESRCATGDISTRYHLKTC